MARVEGADEVEPGVGNGGEVLVDDRLDGRLAAAVVVRVVEGAPVDAHRVVVFGKGGKGGK